MLSLFKTVSNATPRIAMMMSKSPTLLVAENCMVPHQVISLFHTSVVLERARKGTRERKRKIVLANIKKKAERLRKNPPPMPKKIELMLKTKGLFGPPKPIREVQKDKSFPTDDLYFIDHFAYRRWNFEEAIKNLRDHYQPSLLNRPNDLLYVRVELNMRGQRKEKFLDEFSKMVPILHSYDRQVPDRNVMVFVPTDELKEEAMKAGAFSAGGLDLITDICKGRVELADIDYFLCHEELAGSMKQLVGQLRDKVPKLTDGTIGTDVPRLVKTFGKGMYVDVLKMKPTLGIADEPDFGYCEATIGTLEMEEHQLNDNLTALLETLSENKPKRRDGSQDFLTRCILKLRPLSGGISEPNLTFSIIHSLIVDSRVEEQSIAFTSGRDEVIQRVENLKIQTA